MSINTLQTSTNWQDKYSGGVSQTNYTKSLNHSQHKPVKFTNSDVSVSRRSRFKDKLFDFEQMPKGITKNKEKSNQGEILAALIKSKSLSEHKLAMDRWESYVDQLYIEAELGDSGFTTKVLDHARQILKSLNGYFTQDQFFLEVPDACPGESDNFMFLWDRGEHYLECEIFGDGIVEFFYRNRSTNEIWGEDIAVDTKLTPAIRKKLMLFVIPKR